MNENYTEELKEFIGPAEEGREDYFNLTPEETLEKIKSGLEKAFSVNLWTYKWPEEQINETDKQLWKEGITHCFDEVLDAIVCFKSVEDMVGFYHNIRKDMSDEDMQNLKDAGYNTPVLKWFGEIKLRDSEK